METTHKVIYSSSQNMAEVTDETVDLVVTSPPYPMVQMWDEVFSQMNPEIEKKLENKEGILAFELMHQELDKVWVEVARVVKHGGFVCINIGDATRTIGDEFRLYPSHARIIDFFTKNGFTLLPIIIWRKPTNSPTKFMGAGMLPAGAYVTLEHEYILIFRKGKKREFRDLEEKRKRYESSFFWEERNKWFSDIWEFPGTNQKLELTNTRQRSGAYPLEIAYRLINMYSVREDLVLDPFLGTGTTTIAAIITGRNSIGYELIGSFKEIIEKRLLSVKNLGNKIIEKRIKDHISYIKDRIKEGKTPQHINKNYLFPVITLQETKIKFFFVEKIEKTAENRYEATYSEVKRENINVE